MRLLSSLKYHPQLLRDIFGKGGSRDISDPRRLLDALPQNERHYKLNSLLNCGLSPMLPVPRAL
jgi:hypothetical protein